MVYIIIAVTIALLLFVIGFLMDTINDEKEENERYYKQLRLDYDAKIEKLKKEIASKDDIIFGYRAIFHEAHKGEN
jgi:hypothetical protein